MEDLEDVKDFNRFFLMTMAMLTTKDFYTISLLSLLGLMGTEIYLEHGLNHSFINSRSGNPCLRTVKCPKYLVLIHSTFRRHVLTLINSNFLFMIWMSY